MGVDPVAAHVERARAGQAEVRAQDAASNAVQHLAAGAAQAQFRLDGDARQVADPVTFLEPKRHERRGHERRDRVAERSREGVAGAVGAGLGHAQPAGREDHLPCRDGALVGSETKPRLVPVALDAMHPAGMAKFRAGVANRAKQGLQDDVGVVGDREELAGVLPFEPYAEFLEEAHRVLDREATQDLSD
jgi:hypothetical protein